MARATSDPRYQRPHAFAGTRPPIRYAAMGRAGGATAASQKAFDESARKNQYATKVICKKAPLARIE